MSNIIGFPNSRRGPRDLLDEIEEHIKSGEIQHMIVVTMDKDTAVHVGVSTSPAHCLIYMNEFQKQKLLELMRNAGMIT